MRVLVVGSGGREHALAWRLTLDPHPHELYAAPGNPGIGSLAQLLPYQVGDIPALLAIAETLAVDLTVVGPEAPLAQGIVDAFRARGLRIFGPTAAAAKIEASKVFAKQLMHRFRIPTPPFQVFEDPSEALTYIRKQARPLVVKADGLAGGKGVFVTDDIPQAEAAIGELMIRCVHGHAADRIVIEDRLDGVEVSVLALVSGTGLALLPPAADYKRSADGDQGPNTGGMGALAPAPLPAQVLDRIETQILLPTIDALAFEGRPYTGVLYAGIMLTADGPKVLEFNCRWGDPEAQVILPLLDGDFATTMVETIEGLPGSISTRQGVAVCVVLAAKGYPGAPVIGDPIDELATTDEAMIFHAGTAVRNGMLVTAGGRVLNVVGTGPTLEHAAERAYAAVERVHFAGMHWRSDIGRPTRVSLATGIEAARR